MGKQQLPPRRFDSGSPGNRESVPDGNAASGTDHRGGSVHRATAGPGGLHGGHGLTVKALAPASPSHLDGDSLAGPGRPGALTHRDHNLVIVTVARTFPSHEKKRRHLLVRQVFVAACTTLKDARSTVTST